MIILNQQDGFDDIDVAILQALQANGRITHVELGRQVNLSSPAVHARVKRLEQAGFIQQYVALLNRQTLGYDLLCFVQVGLHSHHVKQMSAFEAYLLTIPEVLECYHLTGEYDFLLKVVLKDRADLERFIVERLSSSEGIARINTSMVISETKATTVLPLT